MGLWYCLLHWWHTFGEWLLDRWSDFHWCCWEKGLRWHTLREKLEILTFMGIVSFMCLLFSPLLVPISMYFLVLYAWMGLKFSFHWLKDKVAITLVCTLLGLMVGCCGGATGAACGAAFGFFFGVVCEAIRLSENGSIYDKGSWFGIPPYEESNAHSNSGGYFNNGIVKVRSTYEKPWSWKGFQVHRGPREDDLRKDI